MNKLDDREGRLFLAQKIKDMIFDKTKLTCSVGIACNKMLSKICCSINKPDGVTYLEFDSKAIDNFIFSQSIGKVPGIGKINEILLNGIGIHKCRDLLQKCTEVFVNYSANAFEFLMKAGMGIYRNVHEHNVQKSLGVSQSFKPIFKE